MSRGSGNGGRRDWIWGARMRGRCVCINGSCRSLLKAGPHWPARIPRVKEVSPGKLGLAASVHVFLLARAIFK